MKNEKFLQEMKSQTFGVEVEMVINREKAAKAAAEFFGTNTYRYTGQGYKTWSAWDGQNREWKFSRDSSINSYDDDCKCEMVTPVLKYEDMEMLQQLIRVLRASGAKSNSDLGCGVHIHVGGDGHTPKTIKYLCNLMKRYEHELARMIEISPYRMDTYCKMINTRFLNAINEKTPGTLAELAEIWYSTQGSSVNWASGSHYDHTRYHMLNLHAFFNRYHTIEFRMFQFDKPTADRKGGLHAGQLKAMIQLCLAMSQAAKTSSHFKNNSGDIEESKIIRRFFKILHFEGDEFKTARDYFSRNLDRNAMVRTVTTGAFVSYTTVRSSVNG